MPTLVDAIFDGNLIEGYAPVDDPLALASLTIWVPTRRAARALASEFVTRFNGESALLPVIKTLGGVDDDAFSSDEDDPDGNAHLDAIIAPVKRHLILSRLVNGWSQSLNQQQRDLYRGSDVVMPSSLSDAIWFAAELARLMDTVATEESDWSQMQDLVPQDHAAWWQLTLEFLKIATAQWPAILEELGMQDAANQRARLLRDQANSYNMNGSSGPVIAAGSTGSIPATADLLKSIAHLENGAVVLPGLDRDLDNATWEKIDLADNDFDDRGTAPGHPQFGLKKLLSYLGSSRSLQDIIHLGSKGETGDLRLRELLVSEALRPPHSTGNWQDLSAKITQQQMHRALEGIALVEADGDRQEAVAIALALRETLEQPNKTAALVTPDRGLARRVAVELERFGIAVDDSAGQPLRNTPEGNFLRLVLLVAFGPSSALSLINLLKHPICLFGEYPARARHAARLFELAVLRGASICPAKGQFLDSAKRKNAAVQDNKIRTHRALRRLSANDWNDLYWLAEKLDDIFSESNQLDSTVSTVDELTRQSIQFVEACSSDHEGYFSHLFGSENGRALADFLIELTDHGSMLDIGPKQWPDIFDALMGNRVARSGGRSHSRVAILGPLEIRLQSFDRIVLGGLNENTWPSSTRNDAFLSRPMKSALGLPPPERRTGLAAHDFQMLMGTKDIILTRATKSDNAPTIASRWLQRLTILVGEKVSAALRDRGNCYLNWAGLIDFPDNRAQPCSQPRPMPPLAARPTGLSITDIETWVMDPYAIYAKRILKLVPLDPLAREADARERGELYHAIVEDFVRQVTDPDAEDAFDRLIAIARHHFDRAAIPTDVAVQWWPRFRAIAANLLTWHRNQIAEVEKIFVELNGRTDAGLDGFSLGGRVDRIDRLKDGTLAIFDYKTGLDPKLKAVTELNAPQLPLEAAMAVRGGFGAELKHTASKLGYVRLRPGSELQVDVIDKSGPGSSQAHDLGEASWIQLRELINAYRNPAKDYRSKARQAPEKAWESDYDHLARVREWAVVDDEGGD